MSPRPSYSKLRLKRTFASGWILGVLYAAGRLARMPVAAALVIGAAAIGAGLWVADLQGDLVCDAHSSLRRLSKYPSTAASMAVMIPAPTMTPSANHTGPLIAGPPGSGPRCPAG